MAYVDRNGTVQSMKRTMCPAFIIRLFIFFQLFFKTLFNYQLEGDLRKKDLDSHFAGKSGSSNGGGGGGGGGGGPGQGPGAFRRRGIKGVNDLGKADNVFKPSGGCCGCG